MKVYVIIIGDYEGTYFGDAVFSTPERAQAYINRFKGNELMYEEVELDAQPEFD